MACICDGGFGKLESKPKTLLQSGAPAMKSIARSAEFSLRLCFSCLLFIFLTFRAQAHDPGLSTVKVTVGNEQIDVLLGFAQKDVESMLAAEYKCCRPGDVEGFCRDSIRTRIRRGKRVQSLLGQAAGDT